MARNPNHGIWHIEWFWNLVKINDAFLKFSISPMAAYTCNFAFPSAGSQWSKFEPSHVFKHNSIQASRGCIPIFVTTPLEKKSFSCTSNTYKKYDQYELFPR